jgi:sugar phosphate isomerase/epimerase
MSSKAENEELAAMAYRVYEVDFSFYNSRGIYSFETRCEKLKEIGYDATHLSIWHGERRRDAAKLSSVKEKYGLDVTGVYVVLALSLGGSHPRNEGILKLLETIEGCSTVELAIQSVGSHILPSEPSGDDIAVKWLEKAFKICERRNIDILIVYS